MKVGFVKEVSRPLAQAVCRVVVGAGSPRRPPARFASARSWAADNADRPGVNYTAIHRARTAFEAAPVSLDDKMHRIFKAHLRWQQPEAFVITLPKGRVWGRRGAVIADDNTLIGDVSREFGAAKGVYNQRHSVFKQLLLPPTKRVNGSVGVVACPGSATYFHWLFDTLPRIHLLRASGWLQRLDGILIDYEGLPFQVEAIEALKIPPSKLIVPESHWHSHIEVETLVVPSLPSDLCTISNWVVDFLRETFLEDPVKRRPGRNRRLFISRRRAPTRCERNYEEILRFLVALGFEEYFAEEHSVAETASDFSDAEWIIGMHGGGLANLVFASRGTKVIEFLPPKHVDPLFWILSNHTGCRHAYLFAEGDRPDETLDLVHEKIDESVTVSLAKLDSLMQRMDAASQVSVPRV